MKDFQNKVAVITGAASGIGRSIAERCAQEGMKVVLAGINEDTLALAEKDITAAGAPTLAVKTDVSDAGDVEDLARKTLDRFGEVNLLFNNAGISAGNTAWGTTFNDWEWILGVNVWGVIHGLHYFVPIMIEQGSECHIVNTASLAGMISVSNSCPYLLTKHAVVVISESLYREMDERNYRIGVSVLCPGFIKTNIRESERNRPIELRNTPEEDQLVLNDPFIQQGKSLADQLVASGPPPSQVADAVFDAIKASRFYIYTADEVWWPLVRARMDDILQGRNPTNALPEVLNMMGQK